METLLTSHFTSVAKAMPDYSPEATKRKLELLKACSQLKLNNTSNIKNYHNTLLFLCGYAESKEVFGAAMQEMNRLCDAVLELSDIKKDSLSSSGIAFTETQSSFSLKIMLWLANTYPNDVSLHSFDEEGLHPKELLKHSMNEMEFEMISDEKLSKLKWLEKASGFKKNKDILKWYLNKVDELPLNDQLKEQLFESTKLYTSIIPTNPKFSRSFGSASISSRYFHSNGILKKFNEHQLIHTKLPKEKKLTATQKEEVLSASRIALILLHRETDPITYCSPEGIKVFDLEHGLSIALFSIDSNWRLPMESYIGFMMFKNGYPMSYGGAWLFGKRSLIGINIFEAFRGGESAFVFAQLLRTYRQAFGAEQFEVEPYQFGKNNPEGLKSGAFWFYHRFGFRPLDQKLNELSIIEHEKIGSTKGYRSSIEVLKQFTHSNLGVNFGHEKPGITPSHISYFITSVIAKQFNGDRKLAEEKSKQLLKTKLGVMYSKLKKEEKSGFDKLSLYIAFCLDLDKVKAKDKVQLIKLIKEKGTNEFEYIRSFSQFPFGRLFVKPLLEFRT
ncbi:MAG: hypothetical protein SGJ15_14215 [Bacteroidota bacterium]|nr:hypothetical protein [Bacteroidota bacterium]